MNNEQTHTPTPWRIGDAGHTIFGPPNGNPCPVIIATLAPKGSKSSGETAQNAALIVRAVNGYGALERQNEAMRRIIMQAIDSYHMDDMQALDHVLQKGQQLLDEGKAVQS